MPSTPRSTAVEKCFGSLSSKPDTKLKNTVRNKILKVTTDTVDAQVKALQQTAAEAVKAALQLVWVV
jgi:hypothetical protein